MSQRERFLAILVGVLVLGVGGFYFMNQYFDAVKHRDRQIDTLAKRLRNEQVKETKAKKALSRLDTYQKHALPESIRASQAFYQDRLRETLEANGFSNVSVKPNSFRRAGNHGQHIFNLTGKATLEELVQFTYEFYSFNVLHKFSKLTVLPSKTSDKLDISMDVAVLSVDGANEVPNPESVRLNQLTHGNVKDYLDKIASRNLFSPANKPPLFTSNTSADAELGNSFQYRVSASDPDKDDKVSFYLGENPPAGLELSESGSLKWTPSELGEFKVTIEARDSRTPAKSTTQELVINVKDPPPPEEPSVSPPSFDEAKYTFLTGTVTVGGQPRAWLNNRPKNRQLRLAPGETFTIGTLKGKVVDVRDREVVIEIEGDLRLLSIGQPLADALPMGPS
ncbi:cadherin repeat domain-containing protein [Bremerella cremea]|uniref:Cadherin repeat domain-containing protein n=1 Tax=Bremerella cremea TaxID=1031537 RepID=A0A368KXZ2_9BACT|nr:cadherin repeat domain-containing protein [Bremerella cremea]RCS54334.1 cadherin repeat domain-containing protein [Bremerella cremea]